MNKIFSSYYKKLISLNLIIGLFPIIVVSSYLYYDKINAETENLQENLISASTIGAEKVSSWIIERKNNVADIAKNQIIIAETKEIKSASTEATLFDARFNLERQIHASFQTYDWLEEVIVSDKLGNIMFHTGSTFTKDNFNKEMHFQEAVKGNIGISEIYPSDKIIQNEYGVFEKGVPTLLISAPIRGEVGVDCILSARVNVFKIDNIGQKYLSSFASADSYFVNSGGYFISKPTHIEKAKELNLLKTRPELELRLIDPHLGEFVNIFQMANADRVSPNINGYRNYVGDTVVGAITPIKETKWYYLVEVDRNEAFSDIITLQTILLFFIGITIISTIIISILFANKLISPIKRITKKISSTAIDKTGVDDNFAGHSNLQDSEDEIQQLSTAFDSMVKTLSVYTKKIIFSETKYRTLYDSSPDLYRTIDMHGTILDCNNAYAEALGYTKKEIIGRSIFEHVAERSSDSLHDSFSIWKKEGRVLSKEIWMKRKDNSIFPALLNATNLYDDQGNLIGSNTTITDMTEIYKARKEKEEEKTKRLSAIGELSARIAHDLRNPLSVIKTTVDIIKTKNPSLNEITKGELARMDRAIMRMTHQIDDVLDYVKSKPLQLENRSLLEILYSVLERIAVPSTVSINVSKNDAKISCDPEKIEIVFVNLITNAIQAMNNNGVINIRITEQKDNSVIIETADNGPGIPDDILPKIFDPLFTTRQMGTGLGLVSCKSIVERHGGTINVKTEFGKGTTFIIKLPKEFF